MVVVVALAALAPAKGSRLRGVGWAAREGGRRKAFREGVRRGWEQSRRAGWGGSEWLGDGGQGWQRGGCSRMRSVRG